jgi:predicted metal-dependent phosphoesterase TrpH
MSIDLHVHSKNSDGSLSKEEIIDIALSQQLEAISITDHEYLTEVDVNENIEIIPGVEISVNWHELDIANKYSGTHLLVYFITENSSLNKHLEVLRTKKISRNYQILENLKSLEIEIDKSEIDLFDTKVPGRPHIAELLIKHGYVETISEAFAKYLGNGKLDNLNQHQEDIQNIIGLAKESNCLVFLAHPHTLMSNPQYSKNTNWINNDFEELIIQLNTFGIDGVETYYPGYNSSTINSLNELTKKYNLLTSGGSDFHGDKKPNNLLGIGYENQPINVSYELLNKMKEKHAKL